MSEYDEKEEKKKFARKTRPREGAAQGELNIHCAIVAGG
jgi:hypothetical protein